MTAERWHWSEPENDDQTRCFIQWKSTDVCMDFYCECGEWCHIDGFFCYAVRCPNCKTVWELPVYLMPQRNPDYDGTVVDGVSELENPE